MPNIEDKLFNLLCESEYMDWDKKVEYLIANGVTVQEWISVKDRLPEKSGDYLVLTYNGFIERLSYSERHNTFNADDRLMYAECAIPCTHWMPLPQPPKGE